MKVKIFNETSTTQLEKVINEWLDEHTEVEIVSMQPYSCVLYEYIENHPYVYGEKAKTYQYEYMMTIIYKNNEL